MKQEVLLLIIYEEVDVRTLKKYLLDTDKGDQCVEALIINFFILLRTHTSDTFISGPKARVEQPHKAS